MKTTLTTIAGLAAALVPTTLAAKAYIPYAYNTSVPEIHNKPISAYNGWFFVNTPTTSTCPGFGPGCPSRDKTIISGPTPDFWMGVLETGGQVVFSDGYARMTALGYAAANSSNYLPYASTTGYFGLANTTDGRVLFQEWGENWSACDVYFDNNGEALPTGKGSFSVRQGTSQDFADQSITCYAFEMVLVETDAPAVQYYNCEGCEYRCDNRYDFGCSQQPTVYQ